MTSLSPVEFAMATRLLVVATMFLVLRSFRRSPIFYALLYWPSTIGHELSHFFIGILLAAKPVGFTVIPRRPNGANYLVLGEVAFVRLRWWNKLPVGVAPLLLMPPLGGWLLLQSMPSPLFSMTALLLQFGALQCFAGSWPSSTDWRHAWTTIFAITSLAIIGLVIYLTVSH